MNKKAIYKILKLYKNNSDIPTYEVYAFEDNLENRMGNFYLERSKADSVCKCLNESVFC